jgi:hypothetical protein
MLKPHLVPGRTLRVGVVGVRRLDPANADHLRLEIDKLLRDVDNQATLDGEESLPAMEIVSCLAEGAERLVTDWAIKAGYQLTCVLPFRQATYEEDFSGTDSIAAFRALLERAEGQVLELDGSRAEEDRAYAAACRLVVHNSDLIIAIWDGRAGGSRDTTEMAVRLAAEAGPPVALLHPSQTRPARWIESPHDLVAGAAAARATERLPLYVHRLMALPDPPETGIGMLHAVARAVRRLVWEPIRMAAKRGPSQPVLDFLAARERPAWAPLQVHDWVMAVLGWVPSAAGGRPRDDEPPMPPEADAWSRWFAHADREARTHAARDRTAVLLGFAALGVCLAALALRSTGPAAGAAVLIALLVIADGLFGWRAKARSYRLVAAFCRVQQLLAPLGWRLPNTGGWASGVRERVGTWGPPRIDPIAWEAWLYSAWLRDVRVPFGAMDRDRVEMARDSALNGVLQERADTLERDAVRQHQAGLRLRLIGEACLLATLVIVVAHDRMGNDAWLARSGVILPAVAIAVLGYAAWTRLRGHAVEATLALRAVRRTRQRIAAMDCAAPLASQALGAELAALGQVLMAATPGWDALVQAGVDGVDQMFDPLEDAEKARAKLTVNGVDELPGDAPQMGAPNVPLERLPRHRVPRGKVRLRRR